MFFTHHAKSEGFLSSAPIIIQDISNTGGIFSQVTKNEQIGTSTPLPSHPPGFASEMRYDNVILLIQPLGIPKMTVALK